MPPKKTDISAIIKRVRDYTGQLEKDRVALIEYIRAQADKHGLKAVCQAGGVARNNAPAFLKPESRKMSAEKLAEWAETISSSFPE